MRFIGRSWTRIVLSLFLGVLTQAVALAAPVAIFGDSQHDPAAQRKVVAAVAAAKPAAVFRVGDLVDNGLDPELWKDFNAINAPLLSSTEYYPALGNHERSSHLYFKNFPVVKGRHWYSVNREGIHFIVLDSNVALKPGSLQYRWLEDDLKEARRQGLFPVAIFHHPLFDVGRHQADEKGQRPYLLPLFNKFGLKLAFSGHDHSYQRFASGGFTQIVTGGGGSHLDHQYREDPALVKFKRAFHFCLLSMEKNACRVRVYDIDGDLIDEFFIST